MINELGYEVLNQDWSGYGRKRGSANRAGCHRARNQPLYQQEGIAAAAQPCVAAAQRADYAEMSWTRSNEAWQNDSPSVLIGIADIPQAQKQRSSSSISKRWNILLTGSLGYRKDHFPSDSRNGSGHKQFPGPDYVSA